MNVSLLYGSYREGRLGIRLVQHLRKSLEARGHTVSVIDALESQFPFLEKRYSDYAPGEAPQSMRKVSETLSQSDAIVLVSGEYNLSVQPGLKNLLDHFLKEYFFRIGAIATYSSGIFAGQRVAPHLRAICGQIGLATIPTIYSVGKIGEVLTAEGDRVDGKTPETLEKFLKELSWYGEALRTARAQGLPY